MKKYIFLFFLILFSLNSVYAFWSHNVINYSKNAYNFKPQNWDIDEAENGWMYFANSGGLLEFDGLNWRSYDVPNTILRSVKCEGKHIYVGGSSEFGYFTSDLKGGLIYTSLSDSLTNWGGEVWNILVDNSKVYFQADNSILLLHNNELKIHWSDFKIESSTIIDGVLYCGTINGIFYWNNGKFIPMKGTDILAGKKIINITDLKDGKRLIVTREHGIYMWEKGEISESKISSLDFVKTNQFFRVSVCDSLLAMGSIQHGLFLVNMETLDYQNYSLDKQLQNNTVLNLEFDKKNNLWLALDKGIDYINLSSPILNLFGNKSLIGSGYSSAKFNNSLYLATNQGIYSYELSGNSSMNKPLKLLQETEGQSWNFLEYDNRLFCSNDNAIFILNEKKISRIDLSGCWQICEYANDKNILIAVLYSGLAVLTKNDGEWQYSHHIETTESFLGMTAGDDKNIYWFLSPKYGVTKFSFSQDLKKVIYIKHYNLGDNVGENIYSRKINGQLAFCLKDGIYRYNKLKDEVEPFGELEDKLDGRHYYKYLNQDTFNNIWYVSNNNLKLLKKTEDGSFDKITFDFGLKNMLNYRFLNIDILDKRYVIINTNDGFSLIDITQQKTKNSDIKPFIREITTLVTTKEGINELLISRNDSILEYSNNTLRFRFGATDYSGELEIMYSCRLKGFQESWSLPSLLLMKEYTSLPEGDYIFEIKVFVNGQASSNITSFGFTILPPWYRSIWAYLVYTTLCIISLLMLYKVTIRKQSKIIMEKKQELIDQKKRHLEETTIKDMEIDTLVHEKLRNDLEFKDQQLTSSTLNVIRKNEVLLNIKKSVLNLSKSIDENLDAKNLKRKTIQLLSQIDTNMEHDSDFEKFLNNFDQLHQDFFKKLELKYPLLTKNDKLLCAYTKMNLSAKEIAPLLNISIRGVEIAKYRLRKKMNLERSDNLTEILNNLD